MENYNRYVYVINHAGHDLTDAKQYGELRILTKDRVNIFATDRLINELQIKLREFDPEKDFILGSGSSVLSFIVAKILYSRFDKINYLIYNHKGVGNKYMIRDI